MDHEVIPRPCKICDWLLNMSWDHFNLHQGKNVIASDHGVRGPPEDIFQGLHYPPTWSNGFCSGRGKRGALVEKCKGPWQRNTLIIKFLWIFFGGREGKNNKRQKSNLICFKIAFLRRILKIIGTFTFECMVIPLGPHSVHTWWGAQSFVNRYFKKSNPRRLDNGKSPSFVVRLHGAWCKPALSGIITVKWNQNIDPSLHNVKNPL